VTVADGSIRALTDRRGPDGQPAVSPDGEKVAYVGYDDRRQGYQVSRLYVMNRDGSGSRLLNRELDLDVRSPVWSADGNGLFFQTSSEGNGKHFGGDSGKAELATAVLTRGKEIFKKSGDE